MEDTITQQLDNNDMECVNVLHKAGYRICAAKVAVALLHGDKTQKELVICIGENQSVVSVALRNLINDKLADIAGINESSSKGRPTNVYHLVSWNAIVESVTKKITQEVENKKTQIDRLKTLVNNA